MAGEATDMKPEYNVNRRAPPTGGIEIVFWFCIIIAIVSLDRGKFKDPRPRDVQAEMDQTEADAQTGRQP